MRLTISPVALARCRRIAAFVGVMTLLTFPLHAAQPGQAPGGAAPQATMAAPASDGFEPVSAQPRQEQLPAAPMVMVAYAVVWVAVVLFMLSVWRRQAAVERELKAIETRLQREGRWG